VTDMRYMFLSADSFNQSLGAWDIGGVTDMSRMLDQTALSVDNYDATLVGWEDGPKQNNVVLGASGLRFSGFGGSALTSLICNSYWQISGDSLFTPSDSDQIVAAGC
jgi:hypothetical protein